ncbi:MAG TPA: hypothetical protein VF393_04560 [archaeon]
MESEDHHRKSQAPFNLSKYSLLVVGTPAIGGPGQAVVLYIDRVGDIHGINTATIAVGGGSPERSADAINKQVRAPNGTVVKSPAQSNLSTLIGVVPSVGNGSQAYVAQQAGTQIPP